MNNPETINGLILLGPLLSKLGLMLLASLMVERFLLVIGWIINRSTLISVTTFEEMDSEEREKFEERKRALEESAYLSAEAEGPADPREIEPHPSLENYPDRNLVEIEEILPLGLARGEKERFAIWTRIQETKKEFWMQVLGTLVAIVACFYTKFSVWMFFTWAAELAADPKASIDDVECSFWGFLFTGVIIGAGSKPVNLLMNFLLSRKIVDTRQQIQEFSGQQFASAPMVQENSVANRVSAITVKGVEAIVGFEYDGGDRPERLEFSHLYERKPDMIVYHHTAMHSDSTFADVVKEFDRKKWLTGYHCVVFKDGSIRVLCRWDRFSNHARGYNDRSLSIALNGNFETDPKVPQSNWDGRYGAKYPTTEQLDAAARVVALWAILYGIKPDFPGGTPKPDKGIVPHKYLANKACPGNNFPYERFEDKIQGYLNNWNQDPQFQEQLEDFRKYPMVIP